MNGGLNAQPRVVRDFHATACQDKRIVSWTSQALRPFDYDNQWQQDGDTFGHVAVFRMAADGVEMTANVKMSMCTEMGGLTASSDCSVIAVLCVSRKSPNEGIPNFKVDLVDANKDDQGRAPFGWNHIHEQQPDPESAKRQ